LRCDALQVFYHIGETNTNEKLQKALCIHAPFFPKGALLYGSVSDDPVAFSLGLIKHFLFDWEIKNCDCRRQEPRRKTQSGSRDWGAKSPTSAVRKNTKFIFGRQGETCSQQVLALEARGKNE
jgi:hypothetical protein